MKRTIVVCASVLSALALAGPASAANENSNGHARDLAAKQCAAEKKADKAAFKALYGDHAMRTCIKGTTPEVVEELKNAAKECKAERADDAEGFEATYGNLGKCVSAKVRADRHEEVEEFDNAAKECKAEREADRDAFRETYGSNENGRNALGKCVSQKDDDTDPVS